MTHKQQTNKVLISITLKKSIILFALNIFLPLNTFSQKTNPIDTEVWKPEPKVITPGKTAQDAPSDAIILFNGKDLTNWVDAKQNPAKWKIKNRVLTVEKGTGNIQTKRAFGSCQLHVEWRTPTEVIDSGQKRGNSGIFLMGLYEVQVLDSYTNRTYSNGQAGSIYKQFIPLVNACKPPGEWQTYDIIFIAPKFDNDGNVASPARITVLQNGVLVQNNVEIKGKTVFIGEPFYEKHNEKECLILQDHNCLVSYRNIWIREL